MNSTSANHDPVLIDSVIEVLDQGKKLLTEIDDENYARKMLAAFNASIGSHYRHCLDHFRSLLESAASGDLDYDHRERGTLVETNRFAALNATRDLREAYQKLAIECVARKLNVTCKTSYVTESSQASSSSVGREIMYVVAHAVHHYALIGIMAGLAGLRIPPGFGVAPSTRKFQSDTYAASNCLAAASSPALTAANCS